MSDTERTDSESENDVSMETAINIHQSDDSDEDTDSELSEDEEAKTIQLFVDSLGQLQQNKYNYDGYVELLGLAQ